MADAPYLPVNEAERLRAVQPYVELPTRQAVFQAVVRLTARLFAAPISIMSIVEADEVQYPGNIGMPQLPERLARQDCICSAAVYTSTTTIFPDLRQQPCPWVSPAAQAQTDFQAYAGHPLLTPEGYAIGTLCVLDEVPRAFSPLEEQILQQLAALAMRLLRVHLVLADRAAAQDPLAGIETHLGTSIQRIETLLRLARGASAAVAAGYQADIYRERQLILTEVSHAISKLLGLGRAA